jgi:glycosyltransferase involved in cell wall biosynthesis
MRILLVMGESTGGIGVHVRSLAKGLRDTGHRAVVLQDLRGIRSMAAGADIVHAHGIRAGAATCLALGLPLTSPLGSARRRDDCDRRDRRRRPRLVVSIHNTPLPDAAPSHRLLSAALERVIARRADVVLGASPDLVARAESFGARDVRFAPVAAPPSRPPTRPRDEIRAELGLKPGDRLLLAVGRLAPQKDYATLLDAVAIIGRGGSGGHVHDHVHAPTLLLAIAGDGPLRSDLQQRIDAENLPVRVLGHRADVPDLLNASDAFVMSSTWEARPLALQEALRAGVPSVATAVGGIPELVGPAAVLVPPCQPYDLAEALSAVLAPGTRMSAPMSAWVAAWPGPETELAAALDAYGEQT